MKLGRFEESIKSYEKALAHDKNFTASYVGIGFDNLLLGKYEDARKAYGKLLAVARNDGEKRQALFWMSQSFIWEGQTDKAVGETHKEAAVAEKTGDVLSL